MEKGGVFGQEVEERAASKMFKTRNMRPRGMPFSAGMEASLARSSSATEHAWESWWASQGAEDRQSLGGLHQVHWLFTAVAGVKHS